MKIYIKKTQVYFSEISEIHYDIEDEFKTPQEAEEEETEDDTISVVFVGKETNDCDATEISIERLKSIIAEVEKYGGTHICFDYHPDHVGYIIEGLTLNRATNDEIDQYIDQYEILRTEKISREEKIKSLSAEIKNLMNLDTLDKIEKSIFVKIESIIMECCNWIEPHQINLASTTSDLGLDSLDCIEIIMNIEQAFNITIPDESIENIKNIKELCDLVKSIIPVG